MRGFSTNAIHAGQEPDPRTGAVITPIHPSTTFAQAGVGGVRGGGSEDARSANPTRTALQECLAALEGGRHALAFGSGMGASDVLLRAALRPRDHLVLPHHAYGGTFPLGAAAPGGCAPRCAPATPGSSRTTPTAARSGWSTRSWRTGVWSTAPPTCPTSTR